MALDDILLEGEERMESAVRLLGQRFQTVRTGRATAGLIDGIKVDYYGTQTPLKQLAAISVPDAQMIVVKPFDPGSVKDVEKAILASDIGITPSVEGKILRLSVPPLSGERRKQLAAQVRDLAEETRVAIRNIRRDGNKEIDRLEKDTSESLSEDDAYSAKDEVQDLTRKHESEVGELTDRKSREIMEF